MYLAPGRRRPAYTCRAPAMYLAPAPPGAPRPGGQVH